MPKIVDHEQRRRDIIEATRRLISRGGFERATMREIAAEAGFANGALKHYFASKDDIVEALFQQTLDDMTRRLRDAVGASRGADALRRGAMVALPISKETADAAPIFIVLWNLALTNETLRRAYNNHLEAWRRSLIIDFANARLAGEIHADVPAHQLASEFTTYVMGANIASRIAPEQFTERDQQIYLEGFLRRLSGSGSPASGNPQIA